MLKKYLMIFLVSMVPLIELRGAVPIAVGMNLPLLPSYIICILGNMLPTRPPGAAHLNSDISAVPHSPYFLLPSALPGQEDKDTHSYSA